MNCVREDLKVHITDVLVGEAEASLASEVKAHIASCVSCREDEAQIAEVLGRLKAEQPWSASGATHHGQTAVPAVGGHATGAASDDAASDDAADRLSVTQRQKIESFASRRGNAAPPSTSNAKPSPWASWLPIAASLAAVGIAITMSRLAEREQPATANVALPQPAPMGSSVHELPQAPEGPMLPRATPAEERITAPAADRDVPRPQVKVAPEAMQEFQKQVEGEQGAAVAQAKEQGYQGGRADATVPAESKPVAAGSTDQQQEIADLRKALAEPPLADAAASAEGMKRELEEADRRRHMASRLRELTAGEHLSAAPPAPASAPARSAMSREERDRLGALGYGAPDIQTNRPAPPQPQPRDMFFESKGTNPFVVTEEDPQATFGLDVDTASYTLARNYLNRNTLPPAAAVRVEEFVNAFPNNVTPPRGSEESAFAVRVDGAPNPLHPGYHVLRVALRAKDADPRERKPVNLTFVIDVSGSMAREDRLELVKRSVRLLVDRLDERDTIGIVVYGTTGRRLLAPTSAASRERIMDVINRLTPEGSTNLEDGLTLGYDMAMESFRRGASNRVVLCTDGVANTGQTEADALLARIRNEAKRGIDMMALGFGMGNYNDALLQRLADEGNGQYAYIDDVAEARTFFLRRLTSVLEVVARDAKAQVEFNPARVERYRLVGYEKRDVADRDFRNDAVDAGEINAGHSVTALFEVKLKGGPGAGRIGIARIRYKTGARSEGIEFTRNIEDEAIARNFGAASPGFRTAYVAARFAEHLRKSYWVKDERLSALQPLADELDTPRRGELSDLIRRASTLIRPVVREE